MDNISEIRLSGKSSSRAFRDRDWRMSVITPEKLDVEIGKDRDDRSRRCDGTRPSEL